MSIFSRIKAAANALLGKTESKPQLNPTGASSSPKATPTRSLPTYAVKYSAFQAFMDSHRDHQIRAINATNTKLIGQICIPTGTGKTRIQVHLHVLDMLEKTEKKETGVYVIAAHRLALCRQLLKELVDLVAMCRLPFDVVFVGSSRVDEDDIYEKHMKEDVSKESTYITTGTRQADIKRAVDTAEAEGRHTIIVSTYHSLDHLRLLKNINLITYDEAHTIASSRHSDDDFEAHVTEIQGLGIIKRQYFFTATRKVSGEDYGMNNTAVYGDVLYEEPPINMIKAGEIVPPRVHRITTAVAGQYQNITMVIKTIMEAFSKHRQVLRSASPLAGKLGAKLLVSADGTPEVEDIVNSVEFKVWCFRNKIQLFVFSSRLGFFMFKEGVFTKVPRNAVLDAMQAMDDAQDAILIHIDILTEGIDLPAITGVLPFRELNLIKLLQTIGRAARLLREDRKRLYSGEIKPMQWSKMVKPYCWVIFPKLNEDSLVINQMMENTIKRVMEAYGTPTLQFSREDEYVGALDHSLPPLPPRDKPRGADKETDLIHTIEDMMIGLSTPEYKALAAELAANADPSLKL